MEMVYYPLGIGICLLVVTVIISLLLSMLIYIKQEI